jgi:hypothetical protein
VLVVHLHDLMAEWGLGFTATAQDHKNIILYIASLGKDQNSRTEVQLLLWSIVK